MNETNEWPFAPSGTPIAATPSKRPRLAKGTWTGLNNLIELRDSGTKKTLVEFLKEAISGLPAGSHCHVITCGHSLGGALSPAMALFLNDTQERWTVASVHASVHCYALAGPTIGNEAMASYFESRMGERTLRIWNDRDIVPRAWEVAGMQFIDHIYEPEISTPILVRGMIDIITASMTHGGFEYAHFLKTQPGFHGPKPVQKDWLYEICLQHCRPYFTALGIEDMIPFIAPRIPLFDEFLR